MPATNKRLKQNDINLTRNRFPHRIQFDIKLIGGKMLGKMAVRSIPPEVLSGLETLAAQHDRSVEAEARFALRSWVEPLMQRHVRSARRAEVAARLTDLLDQVNKAHHGRSIKPSHIAQAIGEDYAEHVENWFTGEAEPSFGQLEAVACYLGAVPAWLQHGDRCKFPVDTYRLSDDPAEATQWLLDIGSDKPVQFLHIVRQNNEAGQLTIVKQYEDWHCTTWSTPIHVSEEIGAGGERALAALSVTLELLYKYYCRPSSTRAAVKVIKSYLLEPSGYKALLNGNAHPLMILRDASERPWWEDIWDVDQFRDHSNYWPGWRQLCERIYRAVGHMSGLAQQRELIKRGQHPLLQPTAFADVGST
ncbi:hypothetical protein PQQ52_02370 [Paraburkholderia sediminicola]|uniref:FitA-like ribbon-helix-helix domain-containing protein n=1 Tax=Paraburkholderia sediminicola TaxID=458836 RepID=UPI0038B9454A